MKLRGVLIVLTLALLICLFFVVKNSLASYSSDGVGEPGNPGNVGICYKENWEAGEFYFLTQNTSATNSFYYQGGTEADVLDLPSQIMQDFVVTKWEVTGSVYYKQ